jgi:hypothetical protein
MTALKNIEKAKSFDKRIELASSFSSDTEINLADSVTSLLIEKAKYGQHFTEVLSVVGRWNLTNKTEKLISIAKKGTQHPTQSGSCAWMLSQLGLAVEAKDYWMEVVVKHKSEHPNLYAQILAFGLLIPEVAKMANETIAQCKSTDNAVPNELYEAPDLHQFTYLEKWL